MLVFIAYVRLRLVITLVHDFSDRSKAYSSSGSLGFVESEVPLDFSITSYVSMLLSNLFEI